MKLAPLLLVAACHSGTPAPPAQTPIGPPTAQPTTPKPTPKQPPIAWPQRFGGGPELPTSGVTFADPQQSSAHVEVTAKLVAVDALGPLCGIVHWGTLVEYEVVSVTSGNLVGQHFLALVGCIDLPRPSYAGGAGTLAHFQIGDTHKLLISTQSADGRGMTDPPAPPHFYLISADPA